MISAAYSGTLLVGCGRRPYLASLQCEPNHVTQTGAGASFNRIARVGYDSRWHARFVSFYDRRDDLTNCASAGNRTLHHHCLRLLTARDSG